MTYVMVRSPTNRTMASAGWVPSLRQWGNRGRIGMGVRDSFWSIFGFESRDPSSAVLDAHGAGDQFQLDVKICDAKDIATLWYLRPELMHAIAASEGEAAAGRCIAGITELFKGHQPGGVGTRYATT